LACAWLAGDGQLDPKYRPLMVTRVFRTVIFAGVLLALWTLGRPAHAASLAPFCDDRGATALAPPPALEAPDEAVRRAAAPPCDSDEPVYGHALGPGRHMARVFSGDLASAAAPPSAPRLARPVDRSVSLVARESPPHAGVRYRVERPPRA
jgi:hypothetical protein